jgi:hypothetical protein
VRELQARLTDASIEKAVRHLPAPIFALSGEEIISKLKKRRDDLNKNAAKYYSFIAEEADITGTRRQETFTVTRLDTEGPGKPRIHLERYVEKRLVPQGKPL